MSDPSDQSKIEIVSKFHSYEVMIGAGQFKEIALRNENLIIADRRFQPMLESITERTCLFIDAVESKKTLTSVEEVIGLMQRAGVRRNSTVLAVGGGIIQDVVTLASSLFMRGIAWEYAPTTLLAMADSCIGGKSSINTSTTKNLIGNIYPPKTIYIDTQFVETLPTNELFGGLAEAAKICFCKGATEFESFMHFEGQGSPNALVKILPHVLNAKKWFIQIDEFDVAERKQLNFGHTFGHALEVASGHKIPHGLAVASGMRAALFFESFGRHLSEVEKSLFAYTTTLVVGIEECIQENGIDWEIFQRAFKSDKKHTESDYCLVLPNPNGGVRVEMIKKSEVILQNVISAQKLSLGSDLL
jgi:3-dehydroquinate synthase